MVKLNKSKEEIIKLAEKLGVEYEAQYRGCCESTFLAIADALREGGIEIYPKEMEEKIYSGLCQLTAGICMTGEGSCGAIIGTAMAYGMAMGIPQHSDDSARAFKAALGLRRTLLDKFYEKYRSTLCKDIMRKYFGKAWYLEDNDMTQEFLSVTDGCVIRSTAALGVEIILDALERREKRNK